MRLRARRPRDPDRVRCLRRDAIASTFDPIHRSIPPVLDPSPVVSDPSSALLPLSRRYGSGSGQQSVTGFPHANDANSYWTVKAPHGGSCVVGEPLKNGDAFRLQHVNTRKWLHSHNHASPISHNQEVSCFGGEDESNVDDDWRVETQGGDATWSRNKKVRLVHVSTQVALHSHNQRFGRPISGQFEVCGSRSRDSNQLWIAAEGIYLPSPGPEDAKDEL